MVSYDCILFFKGGDFYEQFFGNYNTEISIDEFIIEGKTVVRSNDFIE